MADLEQRFRSEPLARRILEALPMGVLLFDRERRIAGHNTAAAELIERESAAVMGRRHGDAFRCVHAAASEGGCGHADQCGACLLRVSADEALEGRTVTDREVHVELAGGKRVFLLSAAPITIEARALALVMLQEVPDLHRLRELVPYGTGSVLSAR